MEIESQPTVAAPALPPAEKVTSHLPHFADSNLHLLAHALQSGHEVPSKQTQDRSRVHNARKNSQKNAKKDDVAPVRRRLRVGGLAMGVPTRYGFAVRRVEHSARRPNRRGRRGRGRGPVQSTSERKGNYYVQDRSGKMVRSEEELAKVQVPPNKKMDVEKAKPVVKPNSFTINSPERVERKTERTAWIAEVEKYRKEHPQLVPVEKPAQKTVPEYFRKKKENQKRRRQEKHKLIVENKDRLAEIFGDAIFKRGWPISRKEIRKALGMKEEDPLEKIEGLGEMMGEKMEEEFPSLSG